MSYTMAVKTSAPASMHAMTLMRVDRMGEVGDRQGNALNTGTGACASTLTVGKDMESRTSGCRDGCEPVLRRRSSGGEGVLGMGMGASRDPKPVLTLGRGPRAARTLCDCDSGDVGLINRNSSIPVSDECVIECAPERERERDGRRRGWRTSAGALSVVSRSSTQRSVPPALVEQLLSSSTTFCP